MLKPVDIQSAAITSAGDEPVPRLSSLSYMGDALLDAFPRQALHAFRLALVHPVTGVELHWESPLPADFATLLEALRAS